MISHSPRTSAPASLSVRRRLAVGVSALMIGAFSGAGAKAQQSTGPLDVSERLAVRETGVLLDLPRLKRSAIAKLEPTDLVVSEAGRRLQTTRIARLDPTSEPWTILIYADALMSHSRTLGLSAQALAEAAEQLTELGPVSLVVAGSDDRSLLDQERDPELVADALIELANSKMGTDMLASLRRDINSRPIEDVFLEELSFLRERADRLLVEASSACELPPCLLLNINGGFELAPSAAYRGVPLVQLTRGAGGATHGDIAKDLEQGLASRGWTVLSLALEPTVADPRTARNARERHDVGTDFDAWKATTPGVQTGPPASRSNRHGKVPSQALEVYTEPRLEPLRQLGSATAGAALRVAEQVPIELDRLQDRWWLFYLAESGANDASLAPELVLPLSVAWAEESSFKERRALKKRLGFVPAEEPLRVQRWSRRSAPVLLTEARLRSLKRGRLLVGNLEFEQSEPSQPDISPLQTSSPAAIRFEPQSQRPTVRISAIGPAGSVRHETLTLGTSTDGEDTTVLVDLPVWARKSAAIVEEVDSGRWAVVTR